MEAIPPVEERMNPEQQEDDGLRMRFSDNESKDTNSNVRGESRYGFIQLYADDAR